MVNQNYIEKFKMVDFTQFRNFVVEYNGNKTIVSLHLDQCRSFLEIMEGKTLTEIKRQDSSPKIYGNFRLDFVAFILMNKFAIKDFPSIITSDFVRSYSGLTNVRKRHMNSVREWLIYFGIKVSDIRWVSDQSLNVWWFELSPFSLSLGE